MVRLTGVQLQSGVLPYRIKPDGTVKILLISSSRTKRWTIPKGAAEPHLSLAENAAKEALEEAGLVGQIAKSSAGMYRAIKRVGVAEAVVEVWVFPLRVTRQLDDWPEKRRRRTRWMTCAEAARLLREPFLRGLCEALAGEGAEPAPDQPAKAGRKKHGAGGKPAHPQRL